MIVDIKQFTNALAKITAFASGEKNVPGVLLDINENFVNVCYSDGRKSVTEQIEATLDDTDLREKIVLNYQRLVEIVSVCQPSGVIHIDSLQFIFGDKNVIKIKVEKKIPEQKTADSDLEYRTFSVFEQSISWVPAGSELKVSILSRMNYESIFVAEEVDDWSISTFRAMLEKTSSEKGRLTYVSPKKECAFVANMAYLSCIPIEKKHSYAVIFTSAIAKAIYDILGKVSGQEMVHIHEVDKKFCNIFTEDKKVGICVEMPEANKIHLDTLGRYQTKGYRNYQLTFIKEILKNVIDAAMAADKADKTVLRFGESSIDSSAIELKITSTNTGASISNDYNVLCSGYIDVDNNIGDLQLPISLKVLSDILGKCDKDYVGIDIDVDETGSKFIRIADVDLEERSNAESEVKRELGLEVDEPTPIERQLEYRLSTLVGKHYTLSAK